MTGLYVKNGVTGIQIIKQMRHSLITIKKIDEINDMDNNEFKNFMSDFKFVIIGGSKYNLDFEGLTTNTQITANIDVVKYCEKHDIPLFGIGFGCQIIAFTYGMSIKKLDDPYFGPGNISLENIKNSSINNYKFFKKFNWDLIINAFCYDSNIITNTTNTDINVIVETNNNTPFVIKHNKKHIYGIHSHPDIDSMTGIIFLGSLDVKTKLGRELLDNSEMYLNISTHFINTLISSLINVPNLQNT